jgi:hypothetical protein
MSLTVSNESVSQLRIVIPHEGFSPVTSRYFEGFSGRLWTAVTPSQADPLIVQEFEMQSDDPVSPRRIESVFTRNVPAPDLRALDMLPSVVREMVQTYDDGQALELPPVVLDRIPRASRWAEQYSRWQEQNIRETEERIRSRLLDGLSTVETVQRSDQRTKLDTENTQQSIHLGRHGFVSSEEEKEKPAKRQKTSS